MMDTLQALGGHAGWDHPGAWLRPLLYGLAAPACLCLGTSQRLALRTPAQLQPLWLGLSALYLLVAASCLVQGDQLWLQWARRFFRAHQWYDMRRIFQLGALLAMAWLAGAVWRQGQGLRSQTAARASVLQSALLSSACGTLALYLLRYVSFHYIDSALNARLLQHSVGAWVEYGSLALAALATGLQLLRSDSPL